VLVLGRELQRSCGAPGSTHESGEAITWDENEEPAPADADELRRVMLRMTLRASMQADDCAPFAGACNPCTSFAAVHESGSGTSRRFAAVPNFGSNRGEADMQRASRTCRSNENDPSAGMRPCLCRCEERIRPPHPGKTRPALRRQLGRYASAFLMRSGVNGVWRKRTPVSWAIALPIAGVTNGVAICPTPVGGLSVDITSMCIGGTSLMRGIR
jgi:hypothetical protein